MKLPMSDFMHNYYQEKGITKDGEIIHCACFPYIFGISRDIEAGETSSFEDAYIPLQNPFEAGDIVRIAGDSRPAIVQESREQWYSLLERNTKEPHMFHSTYDDNCLRVEFLGEDGEMFHAHPYLLFLEKVNQWEDKFEWDLLQAMSWLMKGVGEIDYLFCCYEKNLAHKRKGWALTYMTQEFAAKLRRDTPPEFFLWVHILVYTLGNGRAAAGEFIMHKEAF